MTTTFSTEDLMRELDAPLDAPELCRILYIGRFFQGSTGIVHSMYRALDALGHTMYAIDPARHADAFDNPSDATGGFGPIFFKPEVLHAVFDRFRPDMVVFCAGGVVLDDEAAAYLRERDCFTVGITLSDPDVQPSVIDHVHRFDFHTTNAMVALERYEQAGIRNTVLMPFGIDKSYVRRALSMPKGQATTAICIGHASGRADRNEFMTRLADAVDVQCYGSGWELDGSYPVSGDELIAAARNGEFHVNFPSTRAGFTNIKCGVFESIGAGGVLCTEYFDEMGLLFEYGEEIIGYKDSDDLARQIRELQGDPARLEQIRAQGLRRLVRDHLYEQRWLQLFETMSTTLKSGDWMRDTLSRQPRKRPKHVLISGFYGAQNLGDDLLLESISTAIEKNVPDSVVAVAAVHPRNVETRSGLRAFSRFDLEVCESEASGASAVVLGGGGLWHDYSIAAAGGLAGMFDGARLSPAHLAQLPLMVKAHGGKFVVAGMGIGPLDDPAAKAAVRLSGSVADAVLLRDQDSLDALAGVCEEWDNQPVATADAVYALPLPAQDDSVTQGKIVLNLRPWGDNEVQRAIAARVAEFAVRKGWQLVGLSMQDVDRKLMESLLPGVAIAGGTIGEALEAFHGANVVVSMRLHANLLAHRLGLPSLGLAYDPKVTAHFKELGRERFVLPLDSVLGQLDERLAELSSSDGALTADQLELIRASETQAVDGLTMMTDIIADAPTRVSPSFGMVHGLEGAQQRKSLADADNPENGRTADRLRGRLQENDGTPSPIPVPVGDIVEVDAPRFGFSSRAPRKGEQVRLTIPLGTYSSQGDLLVGFTISHALAARQAAQGYISYQLEVNGRAVSAMDIASWKEPNRVWLVVPDVGETTEIAVALVALRDCPDWNWGKASRVTIEDLSVQPAAPVSAQSRTWAASSPTMLDASQFARRVFVRASGQDLKGRLEQALPAPLRWRARRLWRKVRRG